ncbi:helix-turn-helix transcriptional regulator [Rhizobium sp. TH2]|uniref:helix-turn-helix transcriptional regulator n=1 Tax=Rhizobium sp. TH2 TaxID=2775403 RepID=UPI002157BF95|nr:helix-turn-helix transcriptional regulator [Rhizobium sp. TH2]UVC09254.1 helix-turn-helix transcriptional regulator [Rhizobium sp. TH2]
MNFFSTDHLPRRERLGVLHDFVGRIVARRQFRPLDDEIRIELGAVALSDNVMVCKARYSPIAGKRTREMITDGREDYLLTVHDADCELAVEGREPFSVKAGDLMLVSEASVAEFRLPHVNVNVVSLGFAQLKARLPRIDGRPFYHAPLGTAGAALAAGYADLLFRNPAEAQAADSRAASHLYDLAALAFGAAIGQNTSFDRTGIGAARLELIKKDVQARLKDPGLGIGSVAKSQGVSPRYIQRLFEREGTTFSDYVRGCRLELAHAMLCDIAALAQSISSIAYDCGFGDLSHFNRSFRERFDMTPSDIRAATMMRYER